MAGIAADLAITAAEAIVDAVEGEAVQTTAEAASEFIETMSMSDIRETIMETDWRPRFPSTGDIDVVTSTSEFIKGAGVAGITGAGILLPGFIDEFKTPERNKRSRPRITPSGPRGPKRPRMRSVPHLPREKNMARAPARRKRPTFRKVRRMRRRISTGRRKYAAVKSSKLATSSRVHDKIVVINKMLQGPVPTTMETGGSLSSNITNSGMKTTPNGAGSFAYSFKLDQFPNYADYTDIYQWYKILWVKLHFYPLTSSFPALAQSTATNPILALQTDGTGGQTSKAPSLTVAKDNKTDALFGSETIAMQHAGAVHHVFNNGNDLTVYVEPKPTGLIGPAGAEVIYEVPNTQWISTDTVTLPHYGIRCWLNITDSVNIKVVMEMKVAFKHPKV